MFHDLPRQMRISLLKQLLDNSVKHKIHQIVCITSNNGKPEYRERTYAKNDVILKPGWISDAFELSEPEFYKIVTTVTRDDDSPNILLYLLDGAIYRNQLMSLNMRRYIIIH